MLKTKPKHIPDQDYKIRVLHLHEIDFIFPAVENFFRETQDWTYLTFDREKASRRLKETVEFGYSRVIAGLAGDLVVGYVIVMYDDNFTVEKTAQVYSIYVLPSFRGTPLPRKLIDAAAVAAKYDGAVNLHAQALNHLPRGGKSFLNLLTKQGFEPYAGGACKRL